MFVTGQAVVSGNERARGRAIDRGDILNAIHEIARTEGSRDNWESISISELLEP